MLQENLDKTKVILIHGVPMLWNEKDYVLLKNHRIIGTLVGPLPRYSHEKSQFGLPVRLMNVEAKLLQDKGLCDIVTLTSSDIYEALENLRPKYIEREKKVNETQNEIAFQERKSEIIKMAEKILEGKKKKLNKETALSTQNEESSSVCPSISSPCFTFESIIEEELGKISDKESKFVELCMEHPFIEDIALKKIDWSFPESQEEKLRYFVYKDLWEKKYFISCGMKFGGDYIVYQGHPDSYHASFIVKCIEDDEDLNTCDMVAWIRVGTVTKKTLVIASVVNETVHYQSFQWAGEDLANK